MAHLLEQYLNKIYEIDNLSREKEKNYARLGQGGDQWSKESFINFSK